MQFLGLGQAQYAAGQPHRENPSEGQLLYEREHDFRSASFAKLLLACRCASNVGGVSCLEVNDAAIWTQNPPQVEVV